MQEILESVCIRIPHSMKILQCKPLRLEHFLRARKPETVQEAGLKLIIGHAVLLSAAYIIFLIPELFRHPVFTYLSKQTAGILDCSPFQNSPDRDMKGCRIDDLQNARIQYATLAKRNPSAQTCTCKYLL